MTTRSTARNRWTVRCDRCGATSPEVRQTAAKALAALGDVGWERKRPGLEDFCPSCLLVV